MNNLSVRLRQARKAGGLSLRELGDLVGLSHACIKKYEDGVTYPSSDVLIKLANALKVRIDFFFRPIKISLGNIKFRKRSKLSEKSEEAIKFEIIDKIERRFELEQLYPYEPVVSFELPSNLPQKIHKIEEIEMIAVKIRDHWKLGLVPIHDLIKTLESRGIRVFVSDTAEEHFDGLSTIINDKPIIVISSKWPGDRERFTLAHELAHYILHKRLIPELDEEKACNRFAGAFLFPYEAVYQEVGKKRRAIEWQELLYLKEQFQISIGAICYRLRELDVIQEAYFKNMMNHFRKNSWHRREPGKEIPSEKPYAFNQMIFHALSEEYIGEAKAAELLSCSLSQLKEIRRIQNSYVDSNQ